MFAFPSKNKTLGNVVLKAMVSGLLVVVPTEGGQVDHVIHGKTGLLFDADDVDSLVAAVQYLLDHDTVREEMGIQAQKLLANISWATIFDQLIGDYDQAVETGPVALCLKQSHLQASRKPKKSPLTPHKLRLADFQSKETAELG